MFDHVNFVSNDIKIEENFDWGGRESKISEDQMTKFHELGVQKIDQIEI